MYEVRAEGQDGYNTTCLAACRDSQSCHSCGRYNCKGKLCDDCATSCWTLDPMPTGRTTQTLYATPNIVRGTHCDSDWQLAWSHGSVYMFQEHTSGVYQMLAKVYYSNGVRSALFKDVRYTRTYLTVGAFVSGDAGNGWGAPFVNRLQRTYTASNLYPFFYTSGSVSAGGVETYESQMNRNATSIARGYYWTHSDPAIFGTSISLIQLWVKP